MMKTSYNTMRWLGLAVTGGIIAFAGSADAKRPVQPPPEPPPPAGPAYHLVSVGWPFHGDYVGISDSGTVIGAASYESQFITPAKLPVAFIDADGIPQYSVDDFQFLPDVGGEQRFGDCLAASDSEFAAGYMMRSAVEQALLWLPDGTPVELHVYESGSNSHARDINNDGWIFLVEIDPGDTGGVLVPLDTTGDGEPDTWFADDNADGINDLFYPIDPLIMASDFLYAQAINDAGQLLVRDDLHDTAYLFTPDYSDVDGDGNPWFADTNGDGFNDLWVELAPPVPGESFSVIDMNNVGQVVGNSGGHVVRWDFVNGVQVVADLGVITDKALMYAKGIDDFGRIVGTSTIPSGRRTKTGPSWLVDGDTLYELPPLMINGDWSTLTPRGINSAGWICGLGWVAVPVEQP